MKTTVEILQAARNKLIESGWQQGHFGAGDGPFCAVGALRRIMLPGGVYAATYGYKESPYWLLCRAIGLPNDMALSAWNDTPGRTFSEVIDAYDYAIELAKEEER